ncbi:hypothetical protein C461_08419 [Halorubrum aidingense JCM 13560]|uniref:Uncharacterized protein n=1 Tax=Halorubrum aidingense JCM 13560 TaxID=1230454 RepID=M0PC48_9EURY|nr:hypothetical protein [Halorubrum aidingense]EMA67737.1 hypothetical protein C461_08419 [Halorubrum aidingense JCM 13560]
MNNSAEAATNETVAGIRVDNLGPAVVASLASVVLALYFYYVRGDKQRGQFVGLWPSTILALASYVKLEQIRQTLADRDD